MKKQDESRPAQVVAAGKTRKPYHAPRLREFGSLARFTAKATTGGDTSLKAFP